MNSNTLFDDYLIIDWSANNQPKTGKDSIWWCYLKSNDEGRFDELIDNPSTRHLAFNQISDILKTYPCSERRVLVGFDFAYAYPHGFAKYFSQPDMPAWKSVWQYLSEHILDDNKNHNNRFALAGEINQHYFNTAAPFWGCPVAMETTYLSCKKQWVKQSNLFSEFRLAEQGNNTHSVWKLFYNGSVGSQVLTGLPYLYRLISDADLRGVSRVWPFDSGLKVLTQTDLQDCNIFHAEVYPSSIPVQPDEDEVKDRAQVRQLAGHLAAMDKLGKLGSLFAGRNTLTEEERNIVEKEEGWILGVV